jgi:hypothetical protein
MEVYDYYQKQTYRTRCSIYAANGKLDMIVPIKHVKNRRQYTREVRLENDFDWKRNHLKSLQNAYRSSPFFEFYEDEILAFYQEQHEFLLDFLLDSIKLSARLLGKNFSFTETKDYQKEYNEMTDLRYLADFKKAPLASLNTYNQVFVEKYGFIPNLSILDLIFNEGPSAASYFE